MCYLFFLYISVDDKNKIVDKKNITATTVKIYLNLNVTITTNENVNVADIKRIA